MNGRRSTTLHRSLLRYCERHSLLLPGSRIIVAVSGGVDSMVLLDLLHRLSRPMQWNLTVAHVNYGLRGIESEKDEHLVRRRSQELGIPCYVRNTATQRVARRMKLSVQTAAREIRYAFFEEVRTSLGADVIATAHHADDQAETVLFHLLRGSGVEGLAGIPPQRGTIVRPMLGITRKEIAAYAKERKVRFRTDRSNEGTEYSRNFLRNSLLPAIAKRMNPSVTENLAREAELFRDLARFLDGEIVNAAQRCVRGNTLAAIPFEALHPVLQSGVVKRLLQQNGIEPTFHRITSVCDAVRLQKGKIVQLQRGWSAERTTDGILLRSTTRKRTGSIIVNGPGIFTTEDFSLSIRESTVPRHNKRDAGPSSCYVDASRVRFPLSVRTWKPGDRIIPLGMTGRKKVSDLLTDRKLTQQERSKILVVESADGIVWVAGVRLDDRFKLTRDTTSTYHLTIAHHGQEE